ncbi:MAG: hypothetical protein U0401_11240 [Anaerolineae bacterium]
MKVIYHISFMHRHSLSAQAIILRHPVATHRPDLHPGALVQSGVAHPGLRKRGISHALGAGKEFVGVALIIDPIVPGRASPDLVLRVVAQLAGGGD